nr:hypothetical protein OG999_21895 [Streptomyces sp. NBC_00886]
MPTYHEITTADLATLTTAAERWDGMAGGQIRGVLSRRGGCGQLVVGALVWDRVALLDEPRALVADQLPPGDRLPLVSTGLSLGWTEASAFWNALDDCRSMECVGAVRAGARTALKRNRSVTFSLVVRV